MPYYLKTKFSFKCPVERKMKKDVEHSVANNLTTVTLIHDESRIGLWIGSADCVKGQLTFTLDGAELLVEGDFTAKTKLKASDIAEFAEYGGDWKIRGLLIKTMSGSTASLHLPDSGGPEISVTVSDKK